MPNLGKPLANIDLLQLLAIGDLVESIIQFVIIIM